MAFAKKNAQVRYSQVDFNSELVFVHPGSRVSVIVLSTGQQEKEQSQKGRYAILVNVSEEIDVERDPHCTAIAKYSFTKI